MICRIERPDQRALDARGEDGGDRHCANDGNPRRQTAFGRKYEGDESAEHGELALGEVDQRGRLEDHDQGHSNQCVGGSVGQAIGDAVEKEFH